MVYEWGGFKYSTPAQVVGAEVEKIEAEKGRVSSADLVDSARDENSPIHNMFEWDDEIAGENWRKQQAKVILHALKVVYEDKQTQTSIKVRAFINANPDHDGKSGAIYYNIERAMKTESLREGVLERARKELSAFVEKYESLEELKKLVSVIKEFLKGA